MTRGGAAQETQRRARTQETHAGRPPGKRGSIFFDINTEEIQPMDNILHMNTDPTKWRLPREETK